MGAEQMREAIPGAEASAIGSIVLEALDTYERTRQTPGKVAADAAKRIMALRAPVAEPSTDWEAIRQLPEDEIERRALSDPDNPPLTAEEISRATISAPRGEGATPAQEREDEAWLEARLAEAEDWVRLFHGDDAPAGSWAADMSADWKAAAARYRRILARLRAPAAPQGEPCWCWRCIAKRGDEDAQRRMVVCGICGNKRCPHATDHRLTCTASNDSGQPGSVYGPPLRAWHPHTAEQMDREALGRLVREKWVEWAREQPDPKPHWLDPWDELDEPMREVDRRIGEAVALAAAPQGSEGLVWEPVLREMREDLGLAMLNCREDFIEGYRRKFLALDAALDGDGPRGELARLLGDSGLWAFEDMHDAPLAPEQYEAWETVWNWLNGRHALLSRAAPAPEVEG